MYLSSVSDSRRVESAKGYDVTVDELPELLTVEEAAKFLRIGRGLAYQLARQFIETEGREGLPVLRLGRVMRVPRCQLDQMLRDVTALPSPAQ